MTIVFTFVATFTLMHTIPTRPTQSQLTGPEVNSEQIFHESHNIPGPSGLWSLQPRSQPRLPKSTVSTIRINSAQTNPTKTNVSISHSNMDSSHDKPRSGSRPLHEDDLYLASDTNCVEGIDDAFFRDSDAIEFSVQQINARLLAGEDLLNIWPTDSTNCQHDKPVLQGEMYDTDDSTMQQGTTDARDLNIDIAAGNFPRIGQYYQERKQNANIRALANGHGERGVVVVDYEHRAQPTINGLQPFQDVFPVEPDSFGEYGNKSSVGSCGVGNVGEDDHIYSWTESDQVLLDELCKDVEWPDAEQSTAVDVQFASASSDVGNYFQPQQTQNFCAAVADDVVTPPIQVRSSLRHPLEIDENFPTSPLQLPPADTHQTCPAAADNANNVALQFANYHEAQIGRSQREIPHGWRAPKQDKSVPKDNKARARYVKQLIAAFMDSGEAQDYGDSSKILNAPHEVETLCWKLLDIAENLHARGPATLRIFDQSKFRQAYKSRKMKFRKRIENVCELLRLSKARCQRLLQFDDLYMCIAAPTLKVAISKNSKKTNVQRQGELEKGRKVVKGKVDMALRQAFYQYREDDHDLEDTAVAESLNQSIGQLSSQQARGSKRSFDGYAAQDDVVTPEFHASASVQVGYNPLHTEALVEFPVKRHQPNSTWRRTSGRSALHSISHVPSPQKLGHDRVFTHFDNTDNTFALQNPLQNQPHHLREMGCTHKASMAPQSLLQPNFGPIHAYTDPAIVELESDPQTARQHRASISKRSYDTFAGSSEPMSEPAAKRHQYSHII